MVKEIKKDSPLTSLLNMYLNKLGIDLDYLIKSTCTNVKTIKETTKIPTFWAKVFAYANECKTIKYNNKLSNSDLLPEPIWLNIRIKFKSKPMFISNWTKSGILYLRGHPGIQKHCRAT